MNCILRQAWSLLPGTCVAVAGNAIFQGIRHKLLALAMLGLAGAAQAVVAAPAQPLTSAAGIRVVLVQPSSKVDAGMVAVSIPARLFKAGTVSFGLPEPLSKVLVATDVPVFPVALNRETAPAWLPLPAWLHYTDHQRFDISAAPADALPLHVKMVIGRRSWLVTIDEAD